METWLTGHLSGVVSTTSQPTGSGQFGKGSVEELWGHVGPEPTAHSGRDSQWGSNRWHHCHKANHFSSCGLLLIHLTGMWETKVCLTCLLSWRYHQQNRAFTEKPVYLAGFSFKYGKTGGHTGNVNDCEGHSTTFESTSDFKIKRWKENM